MGSTAAGFPEADGVYEVSRSEPTQLAFTRDSGALELGFPETADAVLPALGDSVMLYVDVTDDLYVTVRDVSTGELLMELGNANASFSARETHMAFYELGGDADCKDRYGTKVTNAAIRFSTDNRPIILSPGTDATGLIEGRQYRLRSLGAAKFTHDDSVSDGASYFTHGVIVRSTK